MHFMQTNEPELFIQSIKPVSDCNNKPYCAREKHETKYQLKGYSEHQRQNWAGSKSIVIYECEAQLRKFKLVTGFH